MENVTNTPDLKCNIVDFLKEIQLTVYKYGLDGQVEISIKGSIFNIKLDGLGYVHNVSTSLHTYSMDTQ